MERRLLFFTGRLERETVLSGQGDISIGQLNSVGFDEVWVRLRQSGTCIDSKNPI